MRRRFPFHADRSAAICSVPSAFKAGAERSIAARGPHALSGAGPQELFSLWFVHLTGTMQRLPAWLRMAVLACAPLYAPAQSSTDTVYHLHGSVVNGITGRPIGRALVASPDRRLATMTNADGQFNLDVSVPPAQAQSQQAPGRFTTGGFEGSLTGIPLRLNAQRPGYLPSRQSSGFALDATASTRPIVLRLMPAASIRGRITAPDTEGLSDLRVQLLRRGVQDGRAVWQMAGMRPVSSDGSFRITDLQPGEYTVATSEWSPRTFILTNTTAVTQQYPPHFLGGASTLEAATKLHLAYGQNQQADLHLRTVPYYAVRVPIQGLPPNVPANVRVSTGAGFQLYQLGWNGRENTVEGALPDGDYVVVVSTFGQQHAGAQVPLHIAGTPVNHAPVGLTPTEDIPVIVRDERTKLNDEVSNISVQMGAGGGVTQQIRTPGFYLNVRSEDSQGVGGMMANTAGGSVLQALMPGRYYVQASPMSHGYVAALTCDGVDLLTQALVVNNSGHTAPVEITLRDDSGVIAGTVDLASSGLQAASVLIMPTDGSGRVLYAYAGNSGKFEMGNVAPGSYRVFAMPPDQAGTLPYMDAQAMRPYDGKGAAVTVMAGQTAQVEAELIALDGASVQP